MLLHLSPWSLPSLFLTFQEEHWPAVRQVFFHHLCRHVSRPFDSPRQVVRELMKRRSVPEGLVRYFPSTETRFPEANSESQHFALRRRGTTRPARARGPQSSRSSGRPRRTRWRWPALLRRLVQADHGPWRTRTPAPPVSHSWSNGHSAGRLAVLEGQVIEANTTRKTLVFAGRHHTCRPCRSFPN
jgi:hypothetical protein